MMLTPELELELDEVYDEDEPDPPILLRSSPSPRIVDFDLSLSILS